LDSIGNEGQQGKRGRTGDPGKKRDSAKRERGGPRSQREGVISNLELTLTYRGVASTINMGRDILAF